MTNLTRLIQAPRSRVKRPSFAICQAQRTPQIKGPAPIRNERKMARCTTRAFDPWEV